MAIINNLDLGLHATWQAPLQTRKGTEWGAETQTLVVEGGQSIIFDRSGKTRTRTETIWVSSTPPDPVKSLRLVRQLQELGANPNLHPVYVQWASGGGVLIIDPEDGWYTLESVVPDEEVTADGIIPVTIQVSYLNPGIGTKGVAMAWSGTNAEIGYTGTPSVWIAYPNGAAGQPSSGGARTTAEGNVPITLSLPTTILSPQAFVPSGIIPGTISALFQSRVYCFDTMILGGNPVPTAGAFINPAWVEVLHPDHAFVGDCVITNGIVLFLFQINVASTIATIYGWNLVTSQWLSVIRLVGWPNGFPAQWTLFGLTLQRISHSEISVRLSLQISTSWDFLVLRFIRGQPYVRFEGRALTEAPNHTLRWSLGAISAVAPRVCQETKVLDPSLTAEQNQGLPVDSIYGWAAAFRNNTATPFIYGWLSLNNIFPPQSQGAATSSATEIGSGLQPLQNASAFSGIFLIPFARPDLLQDEGEGGTLGTGWTSVADAAASAGNTARAASGTAAGNADLFGTLKPAANVPGNYNVYFRVRVTSNASAVAEMQLGLWNTSLSSFIASTTLAPNAVGTTYSWIRVATTVGVPTGNNAQFRAVTTGTLATDWFIDEAIICPVINTGVGYGPRELWQQFIQDQSMKLVPV